MPPCERNARDCSAWNENKISTSERIPRPRAEFGTIVLDHEGNVLQWRAEPFLGDAPRLCVGLPLVELLLPKDDWSTSEGARLQAAVRSNTGNATVSLERTIGESRVPAVLRFTTLALAESAVRVVVIEPKAGDPADQQMRIARERIAALRQLASAIGHELSNPLSFIINFGALNAEVAREIYQAVRRPPSHAVRGYARR
jgi:signal transduction histidine kinase